MSKSLGETNSVFQAEISGILAAAHALVAREVTSFDIYILSDSRSAIQALSRNTINSVLLHECHKVLNEVGTINNLTIQWIKGHSEDRGCGRCTR
jgi:ribonuclease HI